MPENPLYSTERINGYHRHEVFFGSSNRQLSIKYGLIVFLPPELHNMSNKGVHFDHNFDLQLKQIGQATAMKYYGWSKEEFIKVFGRNFI